MFLIGGDTLHAFFPNIEPEEHPFCIFSRFEPMLMDYVLGGYMDESIQPNLYTAYNIMCDSRAKDIPFPTPSLAFILADCLPINDKERKLGPPKIPARTFSLVGFHIKVDRIGYWLLLVLWADLDG